MTFSPVHARRGRATCAVALCAALLMTQAGCPSAAKPDTCLNEGAAYRPTLRADALVKQYARWLPAQSIAVFTVDVQRLFEVVSSFGMHRTATPAQHRIVKKHRTALMKELSALSIERLGADLTRARALVVGVGVQNMAIVAVGLEHSGKETVQLQGHEAFKLLPHHPADKNAPVELWGAKLKEQGAVLIVPSKTALSFSLKNSVQSLQGKPELDRFVKGLGAQPAAFAGAALLDHPIAKMVLSQQQLDGLTIGYLRLSPAHFTLAVEGSQAALDKIELRTVAPARAEMQRARTMMEKRRATLDTGSAIAMTVGAHGIQQNAEYLFNHIRKPGRMELSLSYEALTSPGVYNAVGAAIALPAFMRYVNRSKAAEAQLFLRQMEDSARAYILSERTDEKGNKVTCQLPPATGPSMKSVPSGGQKAPASFTGPGWTALRLKRDDPMYFVYEGTPKNDGGPMRYEVTARADFKPGGPQYTITSSLIVRQENGRCTVQRIPGVTTNEFE